MFQTAFQANAFQNNAFQIVITPTNVKNGGDDAPFTREELRRYRAIQKKLRIAEQKRIEALKTDQDARKQAIRDLVDPQPKVSKRKQKELQSNQAVSADTPSQLINIDKYIANLVRQQQDLFDAVQIRQAKLLLEQELAILEAKRLAELDDEEALLLLL
jgi:hypothetical protein